MKDQAVVLRNVSKRFLNASVFYGIRNLLTLSFLKLSERISPRYVIKDVSLTINRGESVALVGGNGAGKSTLLYIIAGILKPSDGEVIINGRVSPILELGTGFHPELNAWENIKLNSVLLGMSLKYFREKAEEILDFAELRNVASFPLKTYSSGMVARLAFSIAVHVEPDILLLDEVLAVGDFRFQKKCKEKIKSLRERATVILVSHSRYDVEDLCDRAILLKEGQVIADDVPAKVFDIYESQC